MRRNEMLDLTWDGAGGRPWVDLAANRIWLPAAYNKSDADQWVPVHPDLAKVLQARRQARGKLFPLSKSPREVSRKFTRLAKNAGLRITLSRSAAVVRQLLRGEGAGLGATAADAARRFHLAAVDPCAVLPSGRGHAGRLTHHALRVGRARRRLRLP
jgi:hypothetical protein